MATTVPLTRSQYLRAAQDYCASLPLEHFMEATPQGYQREVTLESLALLRARRRDVYVFNELLIQYPFGRQRTIHQVVPDNMIVVHDEPIEAEGSYDLPFQPVGPLVVLEYVSRKSKRKDYQDNFRKYEREIKVPYYVIYYPEKQQLNVYRHSAKKYVPVEPNAQGRLPIPELNLELQILDGWVRFWYRGKLLPLPDELQRELDQTRRQLTAERQRAEGEARRAEGEARRAEEQRLRADAAEREVAELRAQLRKHKKNGR